MFLIKPFVRYDQIVMKKTEISWEQNELLRWNKKLFSSFNEANKTILWGG